MIMKNLMLLIVFTISLSCCKNDDDTPSNPIDQLPPATQTGENTFGCLLDGEAFLPGAGPNNLDCVYQFVNGGYFFALQANKRDENFNRITIALGTINLQIEEQLTFSLFENTSGNAIGIYSYATRKSYTSHTHRRINNYKA
ncbi:MAG: hypothetical protein COB60_07120 [Flavobacteriaceae bacterium]|nr:MAG: hypothetical protein COB60_07120 [Flavobacteriaceae bacterium]